MSDTPGNGQNGLSTRVGFLERRVDKLENLEPAVVAERVKGVADEIRDLRGEFKAVKRALYAFAISVSLGAIGFAFTVFSLLGRHG